MCGELCALHLHEHRQEFETGRGYAAALIETKVITVISSVAEAGHHESGVHHAIVLAQMKLNSSFFFFFGMKRFLFVKHEGTNLRIWVRNQNFFLVTCFASAKDTSGIPSH